MNEFVDTTTYHDPLAGRYAGFWVKFFAPVIDMIIFVPIYYGIKSLTGEQSVIGETIVTLILVVAYCLLFASKWQATPGMWLLKFYATDYHGNKLSYGRSLAWVLVSMLGMTLCFSGVLYMQYRFDLNAVIQLSVSCQQENMRIDDCNSELENLIGIPVENFNMMLMSSLGLTVFLIAIWLLSVALAKDKSGFHNLICGTRFLKGRP